jgi:hypothetical protein
MPLMPRKTPPAKPTPATPLGHKGILQKFIEREEGYQERLTEYEKEHPEIPELREDIRHGRHKAPYMMVLRPRFRGVALYHAKYATSDEMIEAMDMYVEWSHRNDRPVTLIGMARFLGFTTKEAMMEYSMPPRVNTSTDEMGAVKRDPGFRTAQEYARGIVEQYTLERALDGKIPPAIARIVLAMHGYTENAGAAMDDPSRNLQINADFLKALGPEGVVQIKRGEEHAKLPEKAIEGAAIAPAGV